MFSKPTYPDLRMSYIRPGWEGKVTSFTVTLVKNTTKRYVFQSRRSSFSHMVHSVHEYYHANQMVKSEGNNNMMQPSSVWAQGPYPVMVGLGEAWCCQSETDHSLPLLTRLNHCLLRQEGRPLQHHHLLLLHVCDSLVALVKGEFVFSPTAKFLKAETS